MSATLIVGILLIGAALWELTPFLKDLYYFRLSMIKRKQTEKLLLQKKNQGIFLNSLYKSVDDYQPKEVRTVRLLDDLEYNLGWKRLAYLDFLENEQVIIFRIMRGLPQKYRDFVHEAFHDRVDIGSVAGGRAISTKQPLVVNNWNKDPHLKQLGFMSEYGGVVSFGAFPIVSNLKTYGSLHVYGSKAGMFKLNEVQFFTTVVNSLAAILEYDELTKGGDKNGNDIGQGQGNH